MRWLLFCTTSLVLTASACAQDPAAADFFEKKIRPVLVTRCYPCHSAASPKVQGGLWIDTRDGLRKGGNSGAPITPGDPDTSLLIKALRYTDPALQMPPGKALSPEIVADFEHWVRSGAIDPRADAPLGNRELISKKARDFWSFQKPVMPAVPAVDAPTPVDAFILARLRKANLTPSPAAEKRTLLRRATYDLIGLPPSPEEIDAFLKDKSPNAFEKVVDRLLASPHYGERWGRHWMDVSRYADTRDRGSRFAFSYTYRDWVIRAFNEDMPYTDFVRKQLSADQLPGDPRDLAALGYITLGRSVPKGENDMIDDRIDVITRGMLGLTVTCARCHDHKFDPIPTRDYYSFYGIVANSLEPIHYPLLAKNEPDSALVQTYRAGMKKRLDAIQEFKTRRHAELVAELRTPSWTSRYLLAAQQASKMSNSEIEKLSRDRDYNLFVLRRWRDFLNTTRENHDPVFASWHALAANIAAAPTGNPDVVKALQAKPPKWMDDVAQVYGELLARFDANAPQQDAGAEAIRLVLRGENTPTNIDLADFDEIRGPGGDANLERALETAVRSWQAEFAYRGLPPRAMALEDSPHPITAHVFLRGNPNNLGVEAPPQFLTVLSKEQKRFEHGSGRLDLANAIASDQNPLTARVIVNRVWQWHFGRGLVTSPSDFGLRGDPPTHPELLDYLSKRFMDEGWSLKKLHKWIMLSSAYQQSSEDRADAHAKDPENKLIWRMNRQRLDYESLRDGILSVSGQLDPTAGGLPYSLTANPTVPRRTVYAYVERGRLPGEMNTFDFANPESHSPQRYQTTVPQQALFFMNSPFIAEEARHLMQRPEIAAARDDRTRVAKLYRAVLGRTPASDEIELALAYIAQPAPPASASPPASPWEYGMGSFNETTATVSFEPFRYFVEGSWQPESLLPHPTVGSANLSAKGGTPGDDPQHAVIRRWTAPLDGVIDIKGTLSNKKAKDEAAYTVRARIVHSSQGKLIEKTITDKKEDLALSSIAVHAGDRIDFIVDFPGEPTNEIFTWIPEITMQEHVWNSAKDFRMPAPLTLTAWEKFAQVLLETNEFAFID